MRLIKGRPNPRGGCGPDGLFLLVGDATRGPIRSILPDDGVVFPGVEPSARTFPFLLKILHFNDLHSHLAEIIPHGSISVFSKIAGKIQEVRRCSQGEPCSAVLAMSGGDDLIGSIFDELLEDRGERYGLHAPYRLSSAAGVDLGVLGNHDLDLGTRLLAQAIQADASFPLLSANLVRAPEMDGHYYPGALIVIKGIRVGVVGLTTLAETVHRRGSAFSIADPIQVAHDLLPALRQYCDVLILLTHLGFSLGSFAAATSGAGDVELARSLPKGSVHLIIGAHTHDAINENGLSPANIVNGIPIAQAGSGGNYLGEVDLTLGAEPVVTHSRLWRTAEIPGDEDFERMEVQPLVRKVRPLFERTLGVCGNHPDLASDSVCNHLADGESAMANFIADGLLSRLQMHGEKLDFVMLDRSILQSGLEPSRQFTYGDWFRVMPFADTMRFFEVDSRLLMALLEENALRINWPEEPNTERGFAHFSRQIRYQVLLGSRRSEARITDASVFGIPLEALPARIFRAAYPGFLRQPCREWDLQAIRDFKLPLLRVWEMPYVDTDYLVRREIVAYIKQHGGVTEAAGAKRDGRLLVH
jgi:2',3'-cyclic-nucleotide 2'-phosphodiesterase (5'-nucleotidase family)